jgi:hypothetical protein
MALGAALLVCLAVPSGASALTTIGQLAPGPQAGGGCGGAVSEFAQPTVTSGNTYVVPPDAVKITSWSTNAGTNPAQSWTMKVYRRISGVTYQVVGHSGPRTLTPSIVNTFSTDVAVQPGDVLGLSRVGDFTPCSFSVPGETHLWSPFTDNPDGATVTFGSTGDNFRLNIAATVATKPSNDFTLGKLKKNKNKGIAFLTVDVPGPGTLKLTGTGVKAQRSGGATASKEVTGPGKVQLKIKAKGKKKAKLLDRGKVKVKAKITFTPNGDVPVPSSTETKPVKLIDK